MINKHYQLLFLYYYKIENYQKAVEDDTQIWHCHHRLEIYDENGKERFLQKSRDELIAENRYYNRPASELIFLTKSEHMRLHMKHMGIYGYSHKNATGSGSMKGKFLSENQKEKISESKIGRHYWNNGVRNIIVFECPGQGWKLGKLITTEERNRAQSLGESNKGRKHSEETKKKMSETHRGHTTSEETRKKISEAKKGRHWKLIDGKRVWY